MDRPKLTFNVLVKREGSQWSAHCLELDIVAAADTQEQALIDLRDLIVAQWEFALENDNLHNFFHPAPIECWNEYLQSDLLNDLRDAPHRDNIDDTLIGGPWIVATNARLCHA